jgi:hypothetical protein
MSTTEIGTIGAETAATAMAPAPAMSEAILAAVALVVAVRSSILLRLTAASNESGKTANFLSAFLSALA